MGDGEMMVVGSNSNAVSSPGKLRSIVLSQNLVGSQHLNLPTTRKRSTIESRRKTETAQISEMGSSNKTLITYDLKPVSHVPRTPGIEEQQEQLEEMPPKM